MEVAQLRKVAIAVVVVTIAAMVSAWLAGADDPDVLGFAVATVVVVALAAFMFGRVIPRAQAASAEGNRQARAGLVTSVIAALTVPVFWLGVPFVLGPAGMILGHSSLVRATGRRQRRLATAALVIGGLAWLVAVVAVVGDEVSGPD